jgi:hypothetical protein
MRKIITIGFIIAGSIVSCQKEEITPTKPIVAVSTCDCYERHETKELTVNQNLTSVLDWKFKYNTTPQPDLCSKETGQWVFSGNATQFRYKVICN